MTTDDDFNIGESSYVRLRETQLSGNRIQDRETQSATRTAAILFGIGVCSLILIPASAFVILNRFGIDGIGIAISSGVASGLSAISMFFASELLRSVVRIEDDARHTSELVEWIAKNMAHK